MDDNILRFKQYFMSMFNVYGKWAISFDVDLVECRFVMECRDLYQFLLTDVMLGVLHEILN
jgi:hypothetical protein